MHDCKSSQQVFENEFSKHKNKIVEKKRKKTAEKKLHSCQFHAQNNEVIQILYSTLALRLKVFVVCLHQDFVSFSSGNFNWIIYNNQKEH